MVISQRRMEVRTTQFFSIRESNRNLQQDRQDTSWDPRGWDSCQALEEQTVPRTQMITPACCRLCGMSPQSPTRRKWCSSLRPFQVAQIPGYQRPEREVSLHSRNRISKRVEAWARVHTEASWAHRQDTRWPTTSRAPPPAEEVPHKIMR